MPLAYLKETASQTAGPYVHIGLIPDMAGFDIYERNFGAVLAGPDTPGEQIAIEGRVLDGSGTPLRDVLIEIWQADAAGRYVGRGDKSGEPADADFRGWGRAGSDFETGLYRFETIKPGPVALVRGGAAAPISTSGSSRAASTSASTRGCIFLTKRPPTPPIRCST